MLAIDPVGHRVVVGDKSDLARPSVALADVNWLAGAPIPPDGIDVAVKLRSMQTAVAARLFARPGGQAEVILAAPENVAAPGQACVFYDGDRVLGGGWIARRPESVSAAA